MSVLETSTAEQLVQERYSKAARAPEVGLCCPPVYDAKYLDAIPQELLDRDYGCGDPTPYVRPGDVVLDLGSGSGKTCFIAAQIAGSLGRVIGLDANAEMLALSRSALPEVARRIGYSNVCFVRGRIQDLALDLDLLEAWIGAHPIVTADDVERMNEAMKRLRSEDPLIEPESIDLVISNCVLNLVGKPYRSNLIAEIYRVLHPGGRVAISDIVCDETVPDDLVRNEALWSGCISGAFEEREMWSAFEAAGFHGLRLETWPLPWQVIDGIEFRAVTLTANKGKEGPCVEENQAVIYRGPWKQVEDDDGHTLRRGERVAVCAKTFRILANAPYALDIIPVPPRVPVEDPRLFDCSRIALRHPRETKGLDYRATSGSAAGCCPPGTCC
jgi:arsenite methyltransferase